MLRAFLLVGLGGGLGSMARYGIGLAMDKYTKHPYPFATFIINILGCFIIGLLFGFVQKNQVLQPDWWLVLATGFCGGFTTFSTFALENNNLFRNGQSTMAILYTVLSIAIGLLLCKAGMAITG